MFFCTDIIVVVFFGTLIMCFTVIRSVEFITNLIRMGVSQTCFLLQTRTQICVCVLFFVPVCKVALKAIYDKKKSRFVCRYIDNGFCMSFILAPSQVRYENRFHESVSSFISCIKENRYGSLIENKFTITQNQPLTCAHLILT